MGGYNQIKFILFYTFLYSYKIDWKYKNIIFKNNHSSLYCSPNCKKMPLNSRKISSKVTKIT